MSQRASITQIDGDNPTVLVYQYRLHYEASLWNDPKDKNPKLMLYSQLRQLLDNDRHRDNRIRDNRHFPPERVITGDVKFKLKQLPVDTRINFFGVPIGRREVILYRHDLKDVSEEDAGINDIISVFKIGWRMERLWKKHGNGQDELYVISSAAPGRPEPLRFDKKGKMIVTHHEEREPGMDDVRKLADMVVPKTPSQTTIT